MNEVFKNICKNPKRWPCAWAGAPPGTSHRRAGAEMPGLEMREREGGSPDGAVTDLQPRKGLGEKRQQRRSFRETEDKAKRDGRVAQDPQWVTGAAGSFSASPPPEWG